MAKWNRIPVGVCCFALLIGCSNESPDPGHKTDQTAGSTTGTAAEVPGPGDDVPGSDPMPDGNSEPPLTDVTEAVSSVPAPDVPVVNVDADTGDVGLAVVTPDEFDAVIAKHEGKVVLVDFWATWCVPCRKSFPNTIALGKKHADNGLVVITMCFDDPEEKAGVLEFLNEHDATGQNLICTFGGADESFSSYDIGEAGLPYYRVYGRDGSMKKAFKNDPDAGVGIEEADVHKLVEELVAASE